MASIGDRNPIAEARSMTAQPLIYEERAAAALRLLVHGRHADKLTARVFGCSPRLAQHLRAGRCWTVARLTQASLVLGVAFDRALYEPLTTAEYDNDRREIAERLARLEASIEQMVGGGHARLVPVAGAPAGRPSRGGDGEVGRVAETLPAMRRAVR